MTQKNTEVIVIGAGYAGLLATVRLAGKTRRDNVNITLVNASDVFVERLRLHQVAANRDIQPRPIEHTLRGTGVKFLQGTVTGLDPTAHAVRVQTSSGSRGLRYDYMLYALGSVTDIDRIPGVRGHAYVLSATGPQSAAMLREALPTLSARRGCITVCGGGATGIEAAAEFAKAYPQLKVTLVTRGAFGAFMGQKISGYMRESLEALGVIIKDNTTIRAVEAGQVVTTMGQAIPHDACLWTGGFSVPALARDAGLAVNDRGQLLIDPFMRSISHPEIFGVGDAAHPNASTGLSVRMSAFTAVVTGAHGADCLSAVIHGKALKPLNFAYAGQGIALGHHNAIGFNTYPNDKPNLPHFTGRAGFEFREFFVRFLNDLPNLERRLPGFFTWLGRPGFKPVTAQSAQSQKI